MLRCSFLIFLQHQKSVGMKGYKKRKEEVGYEQETEKDKRRWRWDKECGKPRALRLSET